MWLVSMWWSRSGKSRRNHPFILKSYPYLEISTNCCIKFFLSWIKELELWEEKQSSGGGRSYYGGPLVLEGLSGKAEDGNNPSESIDKNILLPSNKEEWIANTPNGWTSQIYLVKEGILYQRILSVWFSFMWNSRIKMSLTHSGWNQSSACLKLGIGRLIWKGYKGTFGDGNVLYFDCGYMDVYHCQNSWKCTF